MASDLEYSPTAIEHARNPRNVGPLDSCQGHARITGSCGDTMEFWLRVHDGRIRQANFITDGCGSSAACGSMTTDLAKGRTVEEAYGMEQKDVLDALGGFPEELQHCALLAADTLRAACEEYIKNDRPEGEDQGSGRVTRSSQRGRAVSYRTPRQRHGGSVGGRATRCRGADSHQTARLLPPPGLRQSIGPPRPPETELAGRNLRRP